MNITGLWDQLVQCICRPPRDDNYNIDELPGGPRSNVACVRKDIKLENKRNQRLECSHCFSPSSWRLHERDSKARIPCVVYCHCNSGSRRDAEEATMYLLSKGISVFCLDFAGSGKSQGEYVTLGAHEVDDLEAAVAHLRQDGITGTVGLWGRSMGAVTALLFSQRDPSIAGIVLDSPFSKLTDLMLELVEEQRLPIPRALYKMALGMMRRSVKKRAHFNIDTVSPIDVVQESYIPALFGHGREDTFIGIHHSQKLHDKYGGEKQLITFPGDHNSMRQDHFYRRVQRFFKAVLIDSPAGRPCKAFAHVEIADPRQLKQDGTATRAPKWDEDERGYVSEESYTSRASDQTNEDNLGLGRVGSRPGSFGQEEYDVALAAAIEASLADTSHAAGHAEEETRQGEAREAGPGNETSSGTRPATHVVSGATASSLQHIIPSNVHDMDPEDAEEAMLAQAITASLIESEPDLKAARQSEIEAAGSAQPLHSPEQPNDAGTPYSSTSQTLPVPKWTSAELGVDTSSAPGVSTPTPGGSSPTHPRPIRSPARQGSTGSRPGSASRRSASGISQMSPRLDLMEERSGDSHLSRSPFAGLSAFRDSPSQPVEISKRDGGMQQARPSGTVMSSMSGDIKLPSTAGQTPVDFWLDSSTQGSSGTAAGSSNQREMPTGLEANFTGSLPDSSWPDHDHVHAIAMLKRTSSGTSASSVSSGAEWQTAQHSSQPSNLSSTDRPAPQAGDVQAASSSNPSPQAPRSGAGDASTFSSRQTQSPKSNEKAPDLLPVSTRGQR